MVYLREPASVDASPQEQTAVASRVSERAHPHAQILAELYELHYDRIARFIASRVGNRDTAEDMAGDVFVRAAESIGSYKERGLPMQAWLFKIAHNLVIDHYRRNARRQTVPIDEAGEIPGAADPHADVELRLSAAQVNRMIGQLNPAQQEVISLRFVGGLSAEEAGARSWAGRLARSASSSGPRSRRCAR